MSLWTPGRDRLLLELVRCLEHRGFDRVDLVVSFIQRSGVALLAESIEAATARGGRVRVLTTDYLNITDPAALGWMLDRMGPELEVRVYSESRRSFHPKAYLFRSADGRTVPVAFVGSSNLSYSALVDGIEWNLRVHEVAPLVSEFEGLWWSPYARPLTREWLAAYALRPRPTHGEAAVFAADDADSGLRPNAVQAEALRAQRLRVVDLVANHRSTLLKARLLAELVGAMEGGAPGDHVARLKQQPPDGITLDIAEIEGILDQLTAQRPADLLRAFVDAWTEQHGARPSLLQAALSAPSTVGRVRALGWAHWLKNNSPPDTPERGLEDAACRFLFAAERLPQTRAFTTLALERFIALGGTSGPVSVRRFALDCRDALLADAHLRRDLARTDAFADWLKPEDEPWMGWWRTAFLAPLLDHAGGGALLRVVDDAVTPALEATPSQHAVTWSLMEEIVAWRRWMYVSTLRPVFRGAAGRELDAEFFVEGEGTSFAVTIEARGGERGNAARRNTQYDAGFDLCLERLGALRGRLVGAVINSRAVRDLPEAQRSILPGDGSSIDLASVKDVPTLRRELTSRARKVGQVPGAKGGNAQRRVALSIELPTPLSAKDAEQALVWGTSTPLTPALTPAPARPAAR